MNHIHTHTAALAALTFANKQADSGRYATAQAFYRASDRLARIASTERHLSTVRLYCELVLSGMSEAFADFFASRVEAEQEAAERAQLVGVAHV